MLEFLKSPVKRVIYVKDNPTGMQFLQSGVNALSSISMVGAKEYDRGIAVSARTALTIPAEHIISKNDLRLWFIIKNTNENSYLFQILSSENIDTKFTK